MADKDYRAPGFILYEEDEELFDELTGDEAKALIMACFAFHFRQEDLTDELDGFVRRAFKIIKRNMVRDQTKYEAGARRRREGYKTWKAGQSNLKTTSTPLEDHFDTPSTIQTKTQTKTKTEALAEAQTSAKAESKEIKGSEPFRLSWRPAKQPEKQKTRITRAEFEERFSYLKNPEARRKAMANALEKYEVVDEDSGDL